MMYDNYGNILKKKDEEYTYGKYYPNDDFTQEPILLPWKDLLTYHNGVRIDYDEQGNPTSYLGSTLTWEKGRQLKSYDNNTYTYNANGIRTSKTIRANENDEGVTHYYTLDGTKILRETWGSNTLVPLYDNEESVCGIIYNNVPYYFIKNLQGDVIAIVDKDAQTVARYSYDAWGVVTSAVTDTELTNAVEIATINPFRYRSYYLDTKTGSYFLKTRYYDPEIGRFITIDDISYLNPKHINGLNLYAYCKNNPVIGYDPNGTFALTTFLICLAIGAVIGGVLGGYTAYSNGQDILTGIFTGALLGAAVGAVIGIGSTAVLSGAFSSLAGKAVTDLFSVVFYGGSFGTWEDYAISFAFGGLSGGLGRITSNGGRIASTIAQGGKFVSEILLRPAANQAVKMGTRSTTLNHQKLFYDAVTRSLTYFGTPQIVKEKFFGYDIKIDLGKSFNRATARYLYTYFME